MGVKKDSPKIINTIIPPIRHLDTLPPKKELPIKEEKPKMGKYVGSMVNICYYNSTSIGVNKMSSNASCDGKRSINVNFSYNGKKELYKVYSGTPVICIDNMKDREMFNSQIFTVKRISGKSVTIKGNDKTFGMDEFSKKFNLAFCITV